jgi:hypothetical protein
VVRGPRGLTQGALDAVMRGQRFGDDARRKGGRDEEEHGGMSKRELMVKGLEGLGDTFPAGVVMDIYDNIHGIDKEGEAEASWYQHEDRPREPREPDGEDELEGVAEREHGAEHLAERGEVGRDRRHADDRRHARDRRRGLGMDAKEVFDQMFGADRIKADTDLR